MSASSPSSALATTFARAHGLCCARRTIQGGTVRASFPDVLSRRRSRRTLDFVGAGRATGKRGVWFAAKPGFQPKSGKSEPQPTMRYCWMIEMIVLAV